MNTHTDTYSYAKGAVWTPDKNSAVYLTVSSVQMYWYVNSIRVSYLVTFVNHTDFLNIYSMLVNGQIGAALACLGGLGNKLAGYIGTVAGVFTSIQSPVNFRDSVLSEIDEAAGYQGEDSYSMPIYERGVCLRQIISSSGLPYYDILPWEGPEMQGARGYTGKWEKNRKLEGE